MIEAIPRKPIAATAPSKTVEEWIHIPTPGDHYSPATGSATMAVIHEIAQAHQIAGGSTRVIVGRGTRHDYQTGECVEVSFPSWPTKTQKLIDTVLARLHAPRHFEQKMYAPACDSIQAEIDQPIFLFNSPGVVRMFKRRHQSAKICLYAVNALFRTYKPGEVRSVVDAADRVICCSQFIADDLFEHMGGKSEKVRVVHNGVDVDRFCPVEDAGEVRGEIPVILFVGRAVPQKGPDLLLRAAQRLCDGKRKFKVRIVGSHGFAASNDLTPYETELRTLAEPIKDIVEFQSSVDRDRLLKEYRAASIFCVPSNWEDPFPLTILEATACGLPTVASRRGGIPEVGDGIQYFNTRDIDELAARLANLIDDPTARAQWGEKGRRNAERFSWRLQYEKLAAAVAG